MEFVINLGLCNDKLACGLKFGQGILTTAEEQIAVLQANGFQIIRQWYGVHAKSNALMPPGLAVSTFLPTAGRAERNTSTHHGAELCRD